MTTRDFTANVISATPVVPDGNFKNSAASGVWDINEALDLIKGGNWPNAANIDPSSFVDALFQCHLYNGTGSEQTITNNIDFTKGGLIITKRRDSSTGNGPYWNDTERGVTNYVRSDSDGGDGAQNTSSTGAVVSTSSTGYAVGTFNGWNNSSGEYVSWTFRKQPKFFDIVTWTGNGTENRTISHNLGSVPGMIIVKGYSLTEDWNVYHRGTGNAKYLQLNSDAAASNVDTGVGGANLWMSTDPTSTTFKIDEHNRVNANGESYIAYLFAHNDDDGGFGEPGDQDIIKCDSYTGNGSNTGSNSVTLGFEPQLVMIKRADSSGNWVVVDNMRGMFVNGTGNDTILQWNSTSSESSLAESVLEPTATGFKLRSAGGDFNGSGGTYIYMAIRRGGMQTPTAASDVFESDTYAGNQTADRDVTGNTNVLADLVLINDRQGQSTSWSTYAHYIFDKLRGEDRSLATSSTAAEVTGWTNYHAFDAPTAQGGWGLYGTNSTASYLNKTGSDYIVHRWQRAHGYFDVVAYTGTGSARTVTHNLGVVPEMMWVKSRDTIYDWRVYHSSTGATKSIYLNNTTAATTNSYVWNDTAPTSSVFSLGTHTNVNKSGDNYIAYLFATVADVSKVGSFTYAGSPLNVDCGFSNGAKFILIKESSSAGDWLIFDTTQGIVSGNDPFIVLNDTSSQYTTYDVIDPLSSGFTVAGVLDQATYIFYAIANDPS